MESCIIWSYNRTLFGVSGKDRVCVRCDIHAGGDSQDYCLWLRSAFWCLPPKWMECFRFCHSCYWVSTYIYSVPCFVSDLCPLLSVILAVSAHWCVCCTVCALVYCIHCCVSVSVSVLFVCMAASVGYWLCALLSTHTCMACVFMLFFFFFAFFFVCMNDCVCHYVALHV